MLGELASYCSSLTVWYRLLINRWKLNRLSVGLVLVDSDVHNDNNYVAMCIYTGRIITINLTNDRAFTDLIGH